MAQGCIPCGLGVATPPPIVFQAASGNRHPLSGEPFGLQGLGQTGSQRDYTPDVVGGIAAFTVPFLYSRYRKPKWPKATLWTQLAMVGGTYFAVRWGFTQMQKPA